MAKNDKSRFNTDEEAISWARLTLSPDARDALNILHQEFLYHKKIDRNDNHENGMPELALNQLIEFSKTNKRITLNPSGLHIAYAFANNSQQNA